MIRTKLGLAIAACLLPILAYAAVRAVVPGTATAINPTQIISAGTATATGCSLTAPSGTAPAGQITSGATGACTVTLTMPATKTNYVCVAADVATGAVGGNSAAGSTTTCVFSLTTTSGDVVRYMVMGF